MVSGTWAWLWLFNFEWYSRTHQLRRSRGYETQTKENLLFMEMGTIVLMFEAGYGGLRLDVSTH